MKKYYLPTHSVSLKNEYPSEHLHLQAPSVLLHVLLSEQPQYGSDSHSSTSKE